MTTLSGSTPASVASSANESEMENYAPSRHRRRARWAVVLTLIIGIVISFGARHWALDLQSQAYMAGPYASAAGAASSGSNVATAVGTLDSYFLVLMLGGLRGPLVMYLWVSSENQKNERDLEDFNTKVNLIRLLQPEFESAQSFQVWNLAFNISIQIPSLQDRYAVIIGAAEYARALERARPNSVNVLMMLNQVFQQKLGQTTGDNVYYRRKVREDSFARPADQTVGTYAQRLAPVLDRDFHVLPNLVKPIQPRPGNLDTIIHVSVERIPEMVQEAGKAGITLPAAQLSSRPVAGKVIIHLPEEQARALADRFYPSGVQYVWSDWNDGSELQYLKAYEPYPHGVSPLALGFNYGKRAQVLVNRTKQRPSQLSTSVVDSRPGLELRDWAHEERDRALNAEIRAYYPAAAASSEAPLPQRFARWLSRGPISPDVRSYDTAVLLHRFLSNPNAPSPARPASFAIDEIALEKEAAMRMSEIAPTPGFGTGEQAASSIEEALYGQRLAARLLRDAQAEYIRHISRPAAGGIRPLQDFASHIDELAMEQLLYEADHDFLLAQTPDQGRKHEQLAGYPRAEGAEALLRRAIENYARVVDYAQYVNLRYYTPGELQYLALPPQTSGNPIEEIAWQAAERFREAAIRSHLSAPPINASVLAPLAATSAPAGPLAAAVWAAVLPMREAAGIVLPERQAWRFLPPSAPRLQPSELLRKPDLLRLAWLNMNVAMSWAPHLDLNAPNRMENQPLLERSIMRTQAAMLQLKKMGAQLPPSTIINMSATQPVVSATQPVVPATQPAAAATQPTPAQSPATQPASTSPATQPATAP